MVKPLVLPFRGEQFSFALNYRGSPEEKPQIDLAAVVFDRQGEVHDVVHCHKPSAIDGAVVSSRDKGYWPEGCQAVEGDDVIHFLPKLIGPPVEVIVFVASAPLLPGKANDLNSSSKLDFTVHYPDDNDHAALKHRLDVPLKGAVSADASTKPEGQLGNGHNSIIIGVLYLDKPGWTFAPNLTTFPLDSFGHLVPDLKRAVLDVKAKLGVDLDAARALGEKPLDEAQTLTFTRLLEDHELDAQAAVRLPLPEGAAGPAKVTKLRLDIGWSVWRKPKPPPGEDGEEVADEDLEPEETELDFTLGFYNLAGEEVQAVSSGSTEAEGAKVGRDYEEPEPEEVPEPEAEPEAEEGEEGAEKPEGEGAEGEAEPPKEEVKLPPLAPKEDPYQFTLKHTVFLDLEALPKDVRSIALVVANYAGKGFMHVRHVRVKVFNVSNGEDSSTQKAPTTPPREVIDYGIISKVGQDEKDTQLVLLKLYKEYNDSAFNLWRASGCSTVAEYVTGGTDRLKKDLKAWQVSFKAFKEKEKAALAAAEESGEELTKELRESTWRYAVTGLLMPGASLDAEEDDAVHNFKNVKNYDGPLEHGVKRTFECARVMFENQDTFFGGYGEDNKSGPGVYLFAAGAAYVGGYKEGKRSGDGVMIMPDEGLYEGQLDKDRFHGHGQYTYPDGSVYSGSWAGGLKDGYGVYWDICKGCLRGSWSKGILKGEATYDQPAVHMEATFVQGVPAGPAKYTVVSHRTLDMDKFAAEHILNSGPTLRMEAEYAIPAGSGDDPKLDEEGQPIVDEEKPPLPAFPKYEGLGFKSTALPVTLADVAFPPKAGLVEGIQIVETGKVPVPGVPTFTVDAGLIPAAEEQPAAPQA